MAHADVGALTDHRVLKRGRCAADLHGTADSGADVTTLDHRDLVAALRLVPGVLDADVEPDGTGGLGVLQLGLEPDADEAAVATDVGRLLRERFGLAVDSDGARVVEDTPTMAAAHASSNASVGRPMPQSHAQSRSWSQSPSATASPSHIQSPSPSRRRRTSVPAQDATLRPAISQLHLLNSGLEVTASVTLSSGDRQATGEVTGSASPGGVHRAVADATVRAVEQLVEVPVRFDVEHLEITPMGTERTVVVALSMLSSRGTERLTGAAAVREDVRQAVIRATLDALNRRLELLLTDA